MTTPLTTGSTTVGATIPSDLVARILRMPRTSRARRSFDRHRHVRRRAVSFTLRATGWKGCDDSAPLPLGFTLTELFDGDSVESLADVPATLDTAPHCSG
ncbi:MAG: hypothetical protein DI564_05640 [Rhodanobacter denitrificans]|uniref:Uncharacterized protein n=1 Tax=Rhodanobacter denitrificans TaxID=666685 RepID=A0A2W5KNX8_9GAMM|nr:MAG: hypothetical protein DI564_05640 [Rhodanobacter denitrificans]